MSRENFIAIKAERPSCLSRAKKLAKKLHLPLAINETYPYCLVVSPDQLELRQTGKKTLGSLVVDFLKPSIDYRLKQKQHELLAKAIGLYKKEKLFVIDATAGLGRDGFLLATLGCRVLLLERSSIIFTLLEDGLQRAFYDNRYKDLAIELINIDAKDYLLSLPKAHYPDVIYLDPMFPLRKKSALVKKELQYLQQLLDIDDDSEELLRIALSRAKKRIVVKRPRRSVSLANIPPHHVIIGKDIRFDVYM